jgi:ketosteroid isomerase-like protein
MYYFNLNSFTMKTVFKHTVLALAAILFTTLSFAQVELTTVEYEIPENKDQLVTLASDFYDALIGGDFDKMASLMSDDFQILGTGPEPLGKKDYIELWKSYHRDGDVHGISDGNIIPIQANNGGLEGPALLAWGLASWTPRGADKPIFSWMHMAMRVKNGKINLIYNYQDQLPILMQSGFKVVPPAAQSSGK